MKKLIALFLVMAMALSLAACTTTKTEETAAGTTATEATEAPAESAQAETTAAGEDADSSKILVFGEDMGEVGNLDIWLTTYPDIFELSDLIFDRLVEKDAYTLEVVPNLLTGLPELSEDKLTYTFELKEGVKFHDGTDLTSSDVYYTFNRMFMGDKANLDAWAYEMIAGYAEMISGEATTLSGFTIIDDYHFSITLLYPYTAFIDALACSFLPILPEEACEEAGDRWGIDTTIGSGPFAVEYFEPNVELRLVTNTEYHGDIPAIDGITVLNMDSNTALLEWEAGNIDFCKLPTDLVSSYSETYPDNIVSQSFVGGEWLSLNLDLAPLDDVNVRKAVCLATNRQAIVDGYLDGNAAVATGILPAGIPGHMEDAGYSYDPEAAKQLLTDSGYSDGVTITATCTEGSSGQQIFQILQQDYAAAGITLEIELIDSATWYEQRSTGNCQMYLLNWYADYIDPDMFLYMIYHSNSRDFLSTGMHDDWYDEQVTLGRTLESSEKSEFYETLDAYLCNELYAACPLYYPMGFLLVSDRVDGVFYKPDYLISFIHATVAE